MLVYSLTKIGHNYLCYSWVSQYSMSAENKITYAGISQFPNLLLPNLTRLNLCSLPFMKSKIVLAVKELNCLQNVACLFWKLYGLVIKNLAQRITVI